MKTRLTPSKKTLAYVGKSLKEQKKSKLQHSEQNTNQKLIIKKEFIKETPKKFDNTSFSNKSKKIFNTTLKTISDIVFLIARIAREEFEDFYKELKKELQLK